MVNAARVELENAGVSEKPQVVVADAGYWHQKQMENVIDEGIQVLIPPDVGKRKDTRPGWHGGQLGWPLRHEPTSCVPAGGAGRPGPQPSRAVAVRVRARDPDGRTLLGRLRTRTLQGDPGARVRAACAFRAQAGAPSERS